MVMDSIDVTDFGAKGDGITDDTVALQRTVNYLGRLDAFRKGEGIVTTMREAVRDAIRDMVVLAECDSQEIADAAIRAVIEALAAEAEYLEPDARLSPRDVQRLLRGHLGDTEATDDLSHSDRRRTALD